MPDVTDHIHKAIRAVCMALIECEDEKYAAQIRADLYAALESMLESYRASLRE